MEVLCKIRIVKERVLRKNVNDWQNNYSKLYNFSKLQFYLPLMKRGQVVLNMDSPPSSRGYESDFIFATKLIMRD